MTSGQEQVALQEKLREVLGTGPAATLISMFRTEELATKTGLAELGGVLRTEMADLRTELRGEMADLRTELRGEMAGLRTELRGEMAELRTELRTGMGEVRSEVSMLRQEMELKYATKDDLFGAINRMVRTFVVVQAATVVGMSGILYGFLRLG